MKRNHYPTSMKVGKSTYKVELAPFIEEGEGKITRGYCCTKRKTIVLLATLSEAELFSTFIHELLHAIEHEHDVRIKHSLVYAMEGPISEVLKKNFHLLPKR
jgi:hypothetical protein